MIYISIMVVVMLLKHYLYMWQVGIAMVHDMFDDFQPSAGGDDDVLPSVSQTYLRRSSNTQRPTNKGFLMSFFISPPSD